MTNPFLERLKHSPLLCDGGMGTELHRRGVPYERCFEHLNLTDPELIKSIHLDYIAAGAQVIETNTFGANRYRLAEHGLSDVVREINRAGAKIAREARDLNDLPIFLAGNIGPLGSPMAPLGTIEPEDAYAAFLEQAEALLQAGVDLFLLETFSDVAEIRAALAAVRSVTDLPIVALMTFVDDGAVASGELPLNVVKVLQEGGADVVGVNCALGPASMFEVVKAMYAVAPEPLFVAAQPNAGIPKRVGHRFMYIATPEYFADYTRRFLEVGVRLIGGCCGTTPQHIAAMSKVMEGFVQRESAQDGPPQLAKIREVEREGPSEPVDQDATQTKPTHFAQLLQQKRFVVSIEMSPPRSIKSTRLLQNAAALHQCGADVINIPDNAMARVRMSNIAAARLIQQHVGIETIVHFTPRDRNLMAIQSDIIGAHATDIRNVLAVTGDPPNHGDFPDATGIWDVDSIGLIAIMHNLNRGVDARGSKLAMQCAFHIGCAANPTATDIDLDLERLHQKIENGAMFVMTQPVFDARTFFSYLEQYKRRFGEPGIPIMVGLQPLHSYQQAEKFHNEVPGIVVPEHIRLRLRQAGEGGSKVGVEIVKEIFQEIFSVIQGVYIMPLDRFELISDLLPYIRAYTDDTSSDLA